MIMHLMAPYTEAGFIEIQGDICKLVAVDEV